ncbi:helicase/relaxase domain-containing protein [Fluoribacter dumoffii]|uniref:conjugal transfer nickase/helicase domain-containing protein n=1 Tax=Fluoribacter dumoffii TaxID=463 RepID=UPI002243D617|nr:TraI domain-containing protein [Fluoribacter dumoffii]MCW8387319.1 helicase/relaxase domain-containing protein [Fluoribacter dumoffii]MCW8497523.1 helicase/relaxase domain-containing protein [Fluoribacter dumoffii]
MEMALFHRQRPRKGTLSSQGKSLKELTRIVNADLILSDEKRQTLLKRMRMLSGLETARYDSLCGILIANLVQYCQNLPETANSYYSQQGGLVDHALNRTEAALSLFQEFMVQEQPESLSEEQKLWQYALFSAAILQGIGKLFVDYRVSLYDANGQFLKEWNPLLESLTSTGIYYFYEFDKEPEIEFRRRLNLLLARTLMPASGFAWIASNPEVLAVWLALLNEDEGSAGTLGAILIRAEAIAIQRYLLEFMAKGTAAIYGGGRYRAGTFSGGQPESLLEKEQAVGMEFIQWMIKALDEGRIMINKAPLFMVPGGMLMCAEMFQLFVREHPEYKNWQAAQNGFLALGLHHRAADGGVISRFETKNQMETGVVFAKYALALPESVKVMDMASGKVESMSATELIHKAQFSSQFTQQQNSRLIRSLQKLDAKGTWQTPENEENALRPGAKKGA